MNGAPALDLGPLHDFVDVEHTNDDFLASVLDGLAQPQKRIPSKFFYDARGSRLFDRICELPEYYPTRTECALLDKHAGEIAELVGRRATLVEFGSGSSQKVGLLLEALVDPAAYVPVDISRDHLIASSKALAAEYPDLTVIPVCADYTRPFALPEVAGEAVRAGFFPGSTIGNFTHDQAIEFLRTVAADLGTGSGLLIGVDLRKDRARLHAAYDDAAGVTAAFNLNLLRRINRELGGDFDLGAFVHQARWLNGPGRIEMHLVSRVAQSVRVAGERFEFAVGESIHTEDSHKYTIDGFRALAASAGWTGEYAWTDAERLFSIHYLRAR
jgi:dimethylhistidine N-methyltransferase